MEKRKFSEEVQLKNYNDLFFTFFFLGIELFTLISFNIKLHYNSADKRKEWQFNEYFKKCVVVRPNKKIDVYDFVIRFSSYKIKEFENDIKNGLF